MPEARHHTGSPSQDGRRGTRRLAGAYTHVLRTLVEARMMDRLSCARSEVVFVTEGLAA